MAKALMLAVWGIFAEVLKGIFGDEVKAWLPWITTYLLRIGIERLPENHRERFAEEWASHVNEVPGNIGKVGVAFGCVFAGARMASLLKNREALHTRLVRRFLGAVAATGVLVFSLPLWLLLGLLGRFVGKSLFVRSKAVGVNGKQFLRYDFSLSFASVQYLESAHVPDRRQETLSRLSRSLFVTGLYALPRWINVMRGEITPREVLRSMQSPNRRDFDRLQNIGQ